MEFEKSRATTCGHQGFVEDHNTKLNTESRIEGPGFVKSLFHAQAYLKKTSQRMDMKPFHAVGHIRIAVHLTGCGNLFENIVYRSVFPVKSRPS